MSNPIVIARRYRTGKDGKQTVTKHLYWCPGCDALHGITIRPDKQPNGASWAFTGTMEKPTYSPSQLTTWNGMEGDKTVKRVCHTYIREGVIEFLGDCTHGLKNTKVPLPPLPDWVLRDGV